MKDRFRFRAFYFNPYEEDDCDNKKMYYDAENTYDFLNGVPASSFGDIIDSDFWTVEQCTGLKDKNGNLIYEGDICLKNDVCMIGYRTRTCRVFWHKKWLGWAIETEFGDVYLLYEHEPKQYEVIGNIHENPELLKEEQ